MMLRKTATAMLVASFLLWSAWLTIMYRGPGIHTVISYTDHFSHFSAAILVAHVGLDIYRKPVRDICSNKTEAMTSFAERYGVGKRILCTIGNSPILAINWNFVPRTYPPGVFLFFLPEALLYDLTDLGFDTASLISLIKILAVTHLLLAVLFFQVLQPLPAETIPRSIWLIAAALTAPILYLVLIQWSVAGFYDVLAILCILLAIQYFRKTRYGAAMLLYSLGLFTHYRALWFLPLVLYCLLPVYRQLRERWRDPTQWLSPLLSLGLMVVSLAAFAAVYNDIQSLPHNSPLHAPMGQFWQFPLISALIVATALVLKTPATALLCAWIAVVLVNTVQVQAWHPLFLIPLLAVAHGEKRCTAALLVTLAFATTVMLNVFPFAYRHPFPVLGKILASIGITH